MNAKTLSLLGVVLLLLAGCGSSKPSDTSQPREAVKTALSAIQDDRLDDFRSTLSPDLAKKIGDEPSLLKMRATLAEHQEISLGDEIIIREVADPAAADEDERRVITQEFSEQILGRGTGKYFKLLYMASVRCDFHAQETTRVRQGGGRVPTKEMKEVQTCQITQLE
ncbi:MAG: hypothetical protein ACJ763_19065 [Bdellovibrionia bacterium]